MTDPSAKPPVDSTPHIGSLDDSAEFAALVDDGSSSRWFLPTIAAAIIAIATAFRNTASWDVWWHLAIGREAVRTRATVPVETFSYSFPGVPYAHSDLLADVLFVGAFEPFQYAGIAAVMACALMAGFLGIRLAMGEHARPVLWVVLCAVFAAAVHSRVIPRPLVFTIGLFPLMLGLIEHARTRVNRFDWVPFFFAILPAILLQWMWVNLHRGGLIGLVLLSGNACALALTWIMYKVRPLRPISGPEPSTMLVLVAFAVAIIAGAAGLLNVSGVGLYTSALNVTSDPILRGTISEWQPLTWELARTVHPVPVLVIAVATFALVGRLLAALFQQRAGSVTVWHLGVLAVFIALGISSMRWLMYTCGAAVIVLGLLGTEWIRAREIRTGMAFKDSALRAFAAAAVAVLGLYLLHPLPPGLGPLPNRYPEQALAAADAMSLGPNIHNTFVYGGYAIWRSDGRHKVLIDGRNDMVYPPEFFLRCSQAQHDIHEFATLWQETGGDWVLADNTPGRESFQFLAQHPDWLTVFWSEEAVVYVLAQDHPHLRSSAYHVISAADPVGSLMAALSRADSDDALRTIRDELLRMLDTSPQSVRANALIALYYDHLGPEFVGHRDAVLSTLHDIAPRHPAVIELRARMLGRDANTP